MDSRSLTTARNLTNRLTRPSRVSVLAVALLSASLTMRGAFWIGPLIASLLLIGGLRSPVLAVTATPRFVVASGITCAGAAVLGGGSLSLFWGDATTATASAVLALIGLILTATLLTKVSRNGRTENWDWVVIAVWMVVSGLVAILVEPEPWIDVWALHRDAATALANGQNPYSSLSVSNPMPWFEEGGVLGGYLYPPISLFTFGTGHLVLGDSRWIALACAPAIVFLLRKMSSTLTTDLLAATVLLSPGWPLIVQLAWTEPLSVVLLAAAFSVSASSKARQGILGLLVASKQYLLLLGIPVVISYFRRDLKAAIRVVVVAAFGYGIGLIYGLGDYLHWVFNFHLTTPTATIGSHISGIAAMALEMDIAIPSIIGLGLGLAFGAFVASADPSSDSNLMVAVTGTLTITFLLGSQAFPNYWYFVMFCLVIAILVRQHAPNQIKLSPSGTDSSRDAIGG